MGGPNSGNRWQSGRATCEGALRIDLAYMRRRGLLVPGRQGGLSWSVGGVPAGNIGYRVHKTCMELIYKSRSGGGDWLDVQDWVHFGFSEQHLGGSRAWFICPKCHQRCGVLYGGNPFRCRKCCGLVHQSTREDGGSRLFSHARKLRQKLGEDGGIDDPLPPKPKGMHWKTYRRKIDQIDEIETRADSCLSVYLLRLAELEGVMA